MTITPEQILQTLTILGAILAAYARITNQITRLQTQNEERAKVADEHRSEMGRRFDHLEGRMSKIEAQRARQ